MQIEKKWKKGHLLNVNKLEQKRLAKKNIDIDI